jgi:predicted O-linked N-acetylglucosamine transferase (SPINDLY family)
MKVDLKIYDKNISIREINNLLFIYKDITFINLIIFHNNNIINLLNQLLLLNLDKIIIRVSLFIPKKNYLDVKYLKIFKTRKVMINIYDCRLVDFKKTLIKDLFYFEKIIIINQNISNLMLEKVKSNNYHCNDFLIMDSFTFIEIPYYFSNYSEYCFNTNIFLYFKQRLENNHFIRNYFIIEKELLEVKDYIKLLNVLDKHMIIIKNEKEYDLLLIKKITTLILLENYELISDKLLQVINKIDNTNLLIKLLLIIENTNYNETKKFIINKIILKNKINNKMILSLLIKSLTFQQNKMDFYLLLNKILEDIDFIIVNTDKITLFNLILKNLYIHCNEIYIFDKINILMHKMFDFKSLLDLYKITNNSTILKLVLLISYDFKPIYFKIEELEVRREEIMNNIKLLKDSVNCKFSLNEISECMVNNFYLSYQGLNSVKIFKEKCLLNRYLSPELNFKINKVHKNNKIKILFHSSQLNRNHSVYKDRHNIIKFLANKFEFDVYFSTFDDLMYDVKFTFGKAKHILLDRNLNNIKQILINYNFDIIIYCEIGMDPTSYYMAHLKLAPIQCNTWGHSDTSGIDTIDYFISSKLYELPLEESQKNYSEKLILLNSLCSFYENPTKKYTLNFKNREEFGFNNETKIFFCIQSLFKLSHQFDEYIIEILKSIDNCCLLLLDNENKYNFLKRFENKNVSHKFRFIPYVDHFTFLNYLHISDVVLDSYPFGGCNTSLEAFALNKVVITLPSNFINGRFTSGFYKKMNLDFLINKNKKEYIEFAIKLALDLDFRLFLELIIKQRNHLLFDDYESVNEWEKLMIKIVF